MKNMGGFTLLEILVVISLTVMLTGILLIYGASSRQQIILSIEKAKIAQEILRAKSLSISSYKSNLGKVCGYGIHFNYSSKTYFLFNYVPNPDKGIVCDKITQFVPAGAENDLETFSIDRNLVFGSGPQRIDYVLFVPPDPVTLMSLDQNPAVTSSTVGAVYLGTADGSANSVIKVAPAGQVSF